MRVRTATLASALAAALSLTAGCAMTARPQRLASPLLGGARLTDWSPAPSSARPQPPASRRPADPDRDAPDPGPSDDIRVARAPRPRIPLPAVTRPGRGPAIALARPGDELPACDQAAAGAPCIVRAPDTLDLAALPVRNLNSGRIPVPTAVAVATLREPADLRAMVGVRLDGDPLAFAVQAAARLLGVEVPPVADGPGLVAWAGERGLAADRDRQPGPGELLVFDRVVERAPASLVAVVIGRDGRGVTEMIYLGGGVVRRGFVDVTRPRTARDGERRIVNSFIRHGKEWPPEGTRFLAGELLAHIVRLR